MAFVSLRNCTFTINGHVVEGWADEDEALTFPSTTLANVTRGADGKLQASSTGNLGGPVEIKLLANSKSAAWFAAKVNHLKRGGRTVFNANLIDEVNNVNVVMGNGVLTDVMDAPSMGQGAAGTMNYTIEFETIYPGYDATSFTTIPVTSGETDSEATA